MPKLTLIFLSRVPSLFCTVCRLIQSLIFPPCAACSSAVCRALPPTLRSLFPSVCHALPSHTSESTCRVSGVSRHRVPLHLEGNLTAVCQASHGIVCRYILMRSRVCLYSIGEFTRQHPPSTTNYIPRRTQNGTKSAPRAPKKSPSARKNQTKTSRKYDNRCTKHRRHAKQP